MTRFTLKFLLFNLVLTTTFFQGYAQRSNCSVAPYVNTVTQPDGSQLTLVPHGNEAIHYLETTEGYTVLKNKEGYFEYATTDATGNLTTSGTIARNGQSFKNGTPHLRYNEAQKSMLMQWFNQSNAEAMEAKGLGKAGPYPFPSKGNRKLLVILVEYPDLRATIPQENFELLLNQPNYNGTGSFRDHFYETSRGQLDVVSTVYGWVMAENNHTYYGRTSAGTGNAYNNATRKLLLDALKDANDSFNIDFSEFDTDGDGYVDGVVIMHAGIGAEEASAPNSGNYIWSFRSSLPNSQQPTYDGVKVYGYAMFPERRHSSNSIVGIGVMCHEFAHLLDLPDLYSTQSTNEGIGNFSLMAGGCWLNNEHTPSFCDAWSRIAMGWVTPALITTEKEYTISKSVADSDMVYRVNTSRPNEYYLLENRQRRGFDAFLPSRGLAIWHINSNIAYLLTEAPNNLRNYVNNDTAQLGVGLIQADGQRHLERGSNRGDGNDLYPTNTNKNFGPTTRPASNLHYKISGVKQPSSISISDITQQPDSSITFNFGAKPTAVFAADRASGCAPLTVTFNNTSFGGSAYLWLFEEDNISTEVSPSYTFNKDGDYQVTLYVLKDGVVADSIVQQIKVYPSPEASFTVARDDTAYILRFTNTSKGAAAYQWVFNDGQTTSTATNPIINVSGSGTIKAKLTAYNSNSCTNIYEQQVSVFPLGTEENAASKFGLLTYPNPFKESLSMSFNLKQSTIGKIEIFDLLGAKVITKELGMLQAGSSVVYVDAPSLSNGVYFIKLITETEQGWIKVVKQ
jgi:M6 family metalloprotease-like protein